LQGGRKGNGGERETGKNGKHRGTEGTEKRGREEGKGGEERGKERREEECTECFFAAGLALGLGELCVFAVSLEPTGRLAPFRLHFSKG
jgi:hypothetical protein